MINQPEERPLSIGSRPTHGLAKAEDVASRADRGQPVEVPHLGRPRRRPGRPRPAPSPDRVGALRVLPRRERVSTAGGEETSATALATVRGERGHAHQYPLGQRCQGRFREAGAPCSVRVAAATQPQPHPNHDDSDERERGEILQANSVPGIRSGTPCISPFSAFLTMLWSGPPRSPSPIRVLDCPCLRSVRGVKPIPS